MGHFLSNAQLKSIIGKNLSIIGWGLNVLTYFYKEFLKKFWTSIRDVAKGGPGRAQAHPNVGCALPMKILKSTLTELSNTLLKQSRALIVPCQL